MEISDPEMLVPGKASARKFQSKEILVQGNFSAERTVQVLAGTFSAEKLVQVLMSI